MGCFTTADGDGQNNAPTATEGPTTTAALPNEVTDEFIPAVIPEVDVLFIVDNSCSMWEEQTALVENFPAYMDVILGSGVDYHIGVGSTDMTDTSQSGRLRQQSGFRFVHDQIGDPMAVFHGMAAIGVSGDWNERGRDAGHAALVTHAAGYNVGFLRPTSGLHIIVVSDNDDHSTDLTNGDWITYLQGEQGARPVTTLSGIVGLTAGPYISEVGTAYIDASDQVGGVLSEISDPGFDQALADVARLHVGLTSDFELSLTPVLGTIEIQVVDDGVTYTFAEGDDWTYDADTNTVTFLEYIPSPGVTVRIHYAVAST